MYLFDGKVALLGSFAGTSHSSLEVVLRMLSDFLFKCLWVWGCLNIDDYANCHHKFDDHDKMWDVKLIKPFEVKLLLLH